VPLCPRGLRGFHFLRVFEADSIFSILLKNFAETSDKTELNQFIFSNRNNPGFLKLVENQQIIVACNQIIGRTILGK
jgi:hypothetical protein